MTEKRPLGKITAILADLGLEVTYAYDDFVFVQQSAFLLQFTESSSELNFFVNTDCTDEANQVAASAVLALGESSINVVASGRYRLEQSDDETLRLDFI